jgi:hypothetical protein
MRLDEVYGTLASFTDEELRAFVAADRRRRTAVERAADRLFLGWLVRLSANDPLAEARVRASAVLREAGLPKPQPTRVALRGLLPPLVALLSVSATAAFFGMMLSNVLAIAPAERAVLGEESLSIGMAAGALLAWLIARRSTDAGPREPADVFGQRLQAAVATLYGMTAGLALLPLAFVVVVIHMPSVADLATVVVLLAGLALITNGLRVGLHARALSGVWRPFEDAALAAVAHGRISDLDEHLLAQPLETVLRSGGARL